MRGRMTENTTPHRPYAPKLTETDLLIINIALAEYKQRLEDDSNEETRQMRASVRAVTIVSVTDLRRRLTPIGDTFSFPD